MNNLLFVYGSLLSADNVFAAYLKNNACIYSPGSFNGKLYDIGEYPGAVVSANKANQVRGIIFSLNNPEEALKVLDDYEGFGPGQEQPNLFIREFLPVKTENEPVNCWVYLYNLSVKGLIQIISGDYLIHKGLKLKL